MKIESPAVGTIDIAEDRIIEFPAGLPGFETQHKFAILHEEGNTGSNVFVLQSMDDPAIAFSITTPDALGVHYDFVLNPDEVKSIGLTNNTDATVAIIVRKDEEDNTPFGAGLRANFMAPLVINTKARKGLQKVISRLGCDITLRAIEA